MTLSVQHDDGLALVNLDRPPVNALDLDLILRLEAAFGELAAQPPAAMVLTGAGRCFSAGVDTRAFAAAGDADRAEMIRAITRMVGRLYGLPFPVVAAVGGHALGGGLVLALACDYRIAADDPAIQLGLSEAKAGVPFPAGPLEVMSAELSPETLRRLTLTSQSFSPADLLARGVLDEVVAREALADTAAARAWEMADQPAFAVVKRQVRQGALDRLAELAASGRDPLIEALSRRS